MLYVLMMVYEDVIEMYNVYNYTVSLIENDTVKLKMDDDDQAMVVDIVLKFLSDELFQTISRRKKHS